MNKLRNTKGITLIALIVTIIVLIILAGVSIAMLTGQNGILAQAKQAKRKNIEAEVQETVDLAVMAAKTEYLGQIASNQIKASEVTAGMLEKTFRKSLNGNEVTANTDKYTVTVDATNAVGGISDKDNTKKAGETGSIDISIGITGTLLSQYRQVTNNAHSIYEIKVSYSGATGKVEYGTGSSDAFGTKYTITFDATDGTFADGEKEITVSVVEGGQITAPSLDDLISPDGYKVDGWYTAETDGTKMTGNETATADVTYYAKYISKKVDETATLRGTYISNYGITYQDMYLEDFTYDNSGTGKYGWRILNATNNGNGTYDLEIVSTGIPAKLYYRYSTVKRSSWGADNGTYGTDYYKYKEDTDYNVYAANGLLNHFEDIEFVAGKTSWDFVSDEYNEGGYSSISGYDTTTNKIFRASSILSGTIGKVRSLMHTDLAGDANKTNKTWYDSTEWTNTKTADTTGLFELQNVNSAYKTNQASYWLASPYDYDTLSLRYKHWYSYFKYNHEGLCGLRPVVSISGVKISTPANGVCSITQ